MNETNGLKITKIPRNRDRHKRRVAAYCRVSTMLGNQAESYEAQLRHYSLYIGAHHEWEFAGIYSDEKSGIKAENRPSFQKLIKDAMAGRVDYILVKSISRFSRNVVDCQKYAMLLQANGVYIHFEKEGLDTSEPTSSMMFSFLTVIAQSESKSISDNVKWGYHKRFKYGQYHIGNNRIFGYDCQSGQLIPNENAVFVQMIFRLALDGKNCGEIAHILEREGIKGRSRRPLTPSGIKYILSNEVYVGDRKLQKQAPVNVLTKKPEKHVAYESYYLKDDHEPIIDRQTWDKVRTKQLEKESENETQKKYKKSHSHFLYGKVFCETCGAPMTRRTLRCFSHPHCKETYKAWTCRQRHLGKKGNGCKNPNIREEKLLEAICEKMGYEKEAFPTERFLSEVKMVYAGNKIEIIPHHCKPMQNNKN